MKIVLFASTNVGMVRDHNEDDFVISENLTEGKWEFTTDKQIETDSNGSLLFVADGMGGANAGEVASSIAQETVREEFDVMDLNSKQSEKSILISLIKQAHQNIVEIQKSNPETAGMGTTAIIGWIKEDGLHIAWSGDSRAYLIREGLDPYPLTDDHSIVWDLVKAGKLTAEEARTHPESNIITQSLGDERNTPKPEYRHIPLQKGDIVLLCSDGLNGMIPDDKLFEIAREPLKLSAIVKNLIKEANNNGGHDNITITAAKIFEIPANKQLGTPINRLGKKTMPLYLIVIIAVAIVLPIIWIVVSNYSSNSDQDGNYDRSIIEQEDKIQEDGDENEENPPELNEVENDLNSQSNSSESFSSTDPVGGDELIEDDEPDDNDNNQDNNNSESVTDQGRSQVENEDVTSGKDEIENRRNELPEEEEGINQDIDNHQTTQDELEKQELAPAESTPVETNPPPNTIPVDSVKNDSTKNKVEENDPKKDKKKKKRDKNSNDTNNK